MSSYLSNLVIVGNLGREPEMRYTPNGKAVTDFSLAVNRQFTPSDRGQAGANGQPVKDVVWFKVSTWGKQAEVCNQYLKKGAKVLIDGRLDYDPKTGGPKTWQGQDGLFHTGFALVAETVRFLSAKEGGPAVAEPSDGNFGADLGPDIPF